MQDAATVAARAKQFKDSLHWMVFFCSTAEQCFSLCCSLTVPPPSCVFAATAENEGRLEAARAGAGEELRRKAAAEEPSAEPEGRSAEAPELARHAGQFCFGLLLLRCRTFSKQPCRTFSVCLRRRLPCAKVHLRDAICRRGRLPNLHFNNKEMRSSV